VSQSLDTLLRLAREARDLAARLLAGELRNSHALGEQLSLLERYRRDYGERLQDMMDHGVDLLTLEDYRHFLDSLDDAIERARESVQAQRGKELQSRLRWQQEQSRLASIDALAARRREVQRRQEQRREARQQDEITGIAQLRKRLAQSTTDQ